MHLLTIKWWETIATIDICRTREFPEVSFDKKSDKEKLREVCPSNSQEIEVDESIQPTRENPEVLFDTESDRRDEDRAVLANTNNVQDAFIVCPMMGTIQADKNA